MKVSSPYVFVCVVLTVSSIIQAKGTKPPKNFKCRSSGKPQRIDVSIKTGSKTFAGTNDRIQLLLLDAVGVPCTAEDLNNFGNDRKKGATDVYALCCPDDFGKSNDSLSGILLRHSYNWLKFIYNDWYVESMKVHRSNFLLFEYVFNAWTDAVKLAPFGVFKATASRSNNGNSSYLLIDKKSF